MSDFAWTLNLHPDDPMSSQVKAIIQKIQQSILNEDEPAPDGAGGSQGRHGGIPSELPRRNKLPIGVSGANRGTISETISPCQQGSRSCSGP